MSARECRHCGRTYETENPPTGCDPEVCEAIDMATFDAHRQTYTMTQADYDGLIECISSARKTSGMWLSGGAPMSSVREAANGAWCELGRRMGFNGMTVRPGASELQFSAVPSEPGTVTSAELSAMGKLHADAVRKVGGR